MGFAGPELLTHMVEGLPTGKTWLRGSEGLPSPSCTQGPCKSRSVRTINCSLDGDMVILTYSRKVRLLLVSARDAAPDAGPAACGEGQTPM